MKSFSARKVLLAALLISSGGALADPGRTLVLLNWSEYLDPDLVTAFERRFDARMQEMHYESDDLLDVMLLETEGRGYDLVLVSGIRLDYYRKHGWLVPIDETRLPNLVHIADRWRDAFDASRRYGVPYFWGSVGIGYRRDLVREPPASWMDLLRPAPYLSRRVGMIDSARDAFGVALKALGFSANTSDPAALREATKLLMAQGPHLNSYSHPNLDERSLLVTGELSMAMLYSGDALVLKRYQPRIEFTVPSEGTTLWVDYWAVLASSQHQDLAWAFLNFINEPENAARQAQFVHYPTPNTAAEKLLPAEFLEDETVYPSEATLARSEFYAKLAPQAHRSMQTDFARILKSARAP